MMSAPAFLYDRRAITHNGLSAEIDAPRVKKGNEWVAEESFWRAPYPMLFSFGQFRLPCHSYARPLR